MSAWSWLLPVWAGSTSIVGCGLMAVGMRASLRFKTLRSLAAAEPAVERGGDGAAVAGEVCGGVAQRADRRRERKRAAGTQCRDAVLHVRGVTAKRRV